MLDPVPGECPARTFPEVVGAHRLQLRPSVGGPQSGRIVGGVKDHVSAATKSSIAYGIKPVLGKGGREAFVDSESRFMENRGYEDGLVD